MITRMPKVGERVRFPDSKIEVTVHHLDGNLVWCVYPSALGQRPAIMPFIGRFADGSFNTYAEIIDE